jgi:hypothetical protein
MAEKKPARAGSRGKSSEASVKGGDAGAAERSADGAAAGSGAASKKGAAGDGSAAKGGSTGAAGSGGAKGRKPASTGGKSGAGAGSAGGTDAKARSKAGAKSSESGGDRLHDELRSFVAAHPHGWNHDEWQGLLGRLRDGGHDTGDTDRIGAELEKERLVHTIEQQNVPGLGPAKVRSLADRFSTLWSFRHASVDDLASVKGIKREQAEKLHESLR